VHYHRNPRSLALIIGSQSREFVCVKITTGSSQCSRSYECGKCVSKNRLQSATSTPSPCTVTKIKNYRSKELLRKWAFKMTTEKVLTAIKLWRMQPPGARGVLIIITWLLAITFGVAFWTIIFPRLVIVFRSFVYRF
jgi:hypothetical protein